MLHAFFGLECPHCVAMEPLLARLEKEEGFRVTRHEVWHSKEGMALLEKYDTGLCGGVPFFYNTDSKEYLCGEVEYFDLLAWARSKKKDKR